MLTFHRQIFKTSCIPHSPRPSLLLCERGILLELPGRPREGIRALIFLIRTLVTLFCNCGQLSSFPEAGNLLYFPHYRPGVWHQVNVNKRASAGLLLFPGGAVPGGSQSLGAGPSEKRAWPGRRRGHIRGLQPQGGARGARSPPVVGLPWGLSLEGSVGDSPSQRRL